MPRGPSREPAKPAKKKLIKKVTGKTQTDIELDTLYKRKTAIRWKIAALHRLIDALETDQLSYHPTQADGIRKIVEHWRTLIEARYDRTVAETKGEPIGGVEKSGESVVVRDSSNLNDPDRPHTSQEWGDDGDEPL